MDSLPQPGARNYTPHLYQTRLHSCKRIRESHWEVWKVLSYYHVKRSSLYRWLKRYDELGENGPGTGGEVDEAVQLDPQNGAWLEDAGPGRVCKAPRVDVNYGLDQVPEVRTASHII